MAVEMEISIVRIGKKEIAVERRNEENETD